MIHHYSRQTIIFKHSSALNRMFIGKEWNKISKIMFRHALPINRPDTTTSFESHATSSNTNSCLRGLFSELDCQFTYIQWKHNNYGFIDRFSKAAHFGTLPNHFSTCKAAELFTNMICELHGYPRSMVLDRDPVFSSNFWKSLLKIDETNLKMSMAYHPKVKDKQRCSTIVYNNIYILPRRSIDKGKILKLGRILLRYLGAQCYSIDTILSSLRETTTSNYDLHMGDF